MLAVVFLDSAAIATVPGPRVIKMLLIFIFHYHCGRQVFRRDCLAADGAGGYINVVLGVMVLGSIHVSVRVLTKYARHVLVLSDLFKLIAAAHAIAIIWISPMIFFHFLLGDLIIENRAAHAALRPGNDLRVIVMRFLVFLIIAGIIGHVHFRTRLALVFRVRTISGTGVGFQRARRQHHYHFDVGRFYGAQRSLVFLDFGRFFCICALLAIRLGFRRLDRTGRFGRLSRLRGLGGLRRLSRLRGLRTIRGNGRFRRFGRLRRLHGLRGVGWLHGLAGFHRFRYFRRIAGNLSLYCRDFRRMQGRMQRVHIGRLLGKTAETDQHDAC